MRRACGQHDARDETSDPPHRPPLSCPRGHLRRMIGVVAAERCDQGRIEGRRSTVCSRAVSTAPACCVPCDGGVSAALLAACKKATSVRGGDRGRPGRAHRRSSRSPAGSRSSTGPGYGNGDYYPKEEKQFLWGEYAKATGDTPEFTPVRERRPGLHRGRRRRGATTWCTRAATAGKDWVDLGAVQPWDTSLIPNAPSLNPKLMESGVIDGEQYFVPLDWGFIAPLVNADHVELERGVVRHPVRRALRGQDRVGRHART